MALKNTSLAGENFLLPVENSSLILAMGIRLPQLVFAGPGVSQQPYGGSRMMLRGHTGALDWPLEADNECLFRWIHNVSQAKTCPALVDTPQMK